MSRGAGPERVLSTPSGSFELLRHPVRNRSTLRAWDAADAYVLQHVSTVEPSGPIGIINDGFGALAAGLHHHRPTVVADTSSSETGISGNLERNNLEPVAIVHEVDQLPDGLATVIIKVPKSLGMLEEQLHHLRPRLAPGAIIVGGGMVKTIHSSTLDLFEAIIGPTTTSLAERKARLIHPRFDNDLVPPSNPWPIVWSHGGLEIHNRGGVFSARSVDIGSRFLLDHLGQELDGVDRLVDLGCGNGILGVTAAATNGDLHPIFVDTSAQAIDSARLTWAANFADRGAVFHRSDRLSAVVEPATVGLVVNNPPFHDDRAVGDGTAWDMFVDSHTALRPGGRLLVVGNRHLGHHAKLKKIFGNCATIASNRKFVILAADR